MPDGTLVHSVLDPSAPAGSSGDWTDAPSLAVGLILPGVESKIHVHPVVGQITWVMSGQLTVKMKDRHVDNPYTLHLSAGQCVVTSPGTFVQWINAGPAPCRVLYIVSPAFVFETGDEGSVVYNDAVVLDEDWDALAGLNWPHPGPDHVEAARQARQRAIERRGR